MFGFNVKYPHGRDGFTSSSQYLLRKKTMLGLHPLFCFGAIISGLFLATTGHAQEAVMSRYETPVAGDEFFAVYGANVDGHLVPRGQLTVDFSHRSFVLTDEAGKELAVPSAERAIVHASASLAFANRFLLSVDAPFAVAQTGDTVALSATRELAPTEGAAVGELRVGLRARLFGHAANPFQVALGCVVYLPTATDAWGGEGYVHAQPTMQFGVSSQHDGPFRRANTCHPRPKTRCIPLWRAVSRDDERTILPRSPFVRTGDAHPE